MDSRPATQHQTVNDSLIEGFAKLLSQRKLDDLPQEILLNIFEHFAEPWVLTDELADWEVYNLDRESRTRQQTLIALTKTCRRLNPPATSILYRCAHLPTHTSVFHFLRALREQPRLGELVKQVSRPQDVLMSVAYTFFFFRPRRDENVLVAPDIYKYSPRIGMTRRTAGPIQFYNSYSRVAVNRALLQDILSHTSGIRALSVTCYNPWHHMYPISSLPLEHLSRLRIAIHQQPEVYLPGANGHNLILTWLSRSALGRYRALEQLELVHPRGAWIAHLVTVKTTTESGSTNTEKYVESLTTLGRVGGGFAEWDLLSLERDIFSPAHFRTLDYAGQSRRCSGTCTTIQPSGWNLNLSLSTTGRRLTTLSLDWEHEHPQLNQLGPAGVLTSLPALTNLTHLTVSMQVLFQQHQMFCNELMTILKDSEAGLSRLLPPFLVVLRISEFMPRVLQPSDPGEEDRSVVGQNHLMYTFVKVLHACWLDCRDDRELWFRHWLKLERHPRMGGDPSRVKLRSLVSPQQHQDVGREFARVPRVLPDVAAESRRVESPE